MNFTSDAFLGGRLLVRQPVRGYRAGADPVFLAAAVPAKPGDSVLELGCGAGVATLCLLARVPEINAVGVERSVEMVELAETNLTQNAMKATIFAADITNLPAKLREQSFDHAMANPPFFDRQKGSKASNDGRETGRGEDTDLFHWVDSAVKRLRPGGTFTLIQRIERLLEVLGTLDTRLGDVRVLPMASRHNRPAKLFLLQAKKGSNAPFHLLPPLVLHDGDAHEKDGDSYSQAAKSILRDGQAMLLNN